MQELREQETVLKALRASILTSKQQIVDSVTHVCGALQRLVRIADVFIGFGDERSVDGRTSTDYAGTPGARGYGGSSNFIRSVECFCNIDRSEQYQFHGRVPAGGRASRCCANSGSSTLCRFPA